MTPSVNIVVLFASFHHPHLRFPYLELKNGYLDSYKCTWYVLGTYDNPDSYMILGTVYFSSRRSLEDDDMIQLYSKALLGTTIGQ